MLLSGFQCPRLWPCLLDVSAEGSGETTNVSDLRRVFLTTGERCNNGQAWRRIQDNGKLGSGKHWTLSFGCCNQKLLKTDDGLCARGFWRFGFRFISRVDDGSSTPAKAAGPPVGSRSLCRELPRRDR